MVLKSIVQPERATLLSILLAFGGCKTQITTIKEQTHLVAETTSPIIAILGTKAIRQKDIWPALIELGGQEVIHDYKLQIALQTALQNKNISILQNDLQLEEELLYSLDSEINEDSFNKILLHKGIGDFRKNQLLWRNAALRKLIQDKVLITDEAVRRMFSIIYGPSYPTQIIVVSTLDEANDVVTSLKNGTTFSDVATHVSIDSSALTGGRIDPISVADPIWPSPIREMVSTIEINSISNPIFIGDRWVVLKVTGEPIKSNTTFDEVKAEMEHLAKLAQERLLMDNLSKSLSETNQIKVFDQDLQRILRANSQGTK